jgi:hypothetical protein
MDEHIDPGTLFELRGTTTLYFHIDASSKQSNLMKGMFAGRLESGSIIAFLGFDVTYNTYNSVGVFLTQRGIFRIFLQDLKLCT